MIINNKLYSLRETYQINDNYKKILNMKLLILNESLLNLRKMFYECKSLQKFDVISPKDIKLKSDDEIHNEKNNNQIEISSIFDSQRINNQSSNHLIYSNETNKNSQKISLIKDTKISSKGRNKFNIIYFSLKNNISYKEKEKMNQIIIESKNIAEFQKRKFLI